MTTPSYPTLDPMVAAVRAACRVCRAVQADLVSAGTVTKDDRSPVTVADFAAQAVASRLLRDALPDVPLVGEEDADLLRQAGNEAVREAVHARTTVEWSGASEVDVLAAIDRGATECDETGTYFTLDPIDGTKGFLRGDQYAVALGLIEDGSVVAGVLGCPNLPGPGGAKGAVFLAVRGQGAAALSVDDESLAPSPVSVSPEADPTRARFCESVEKAHSNKGRSVEVAAALGVTAAPVAIDSQCKYAIVSRGDAELYLRLPTRADYREKIWDHAAGSIIVTESGGRVTDIEGRPLDFSRGRRLEENRGVVASNAAIHDAVIEAIRKTT
ncbi:MAG: 3'(2'),5'-bisphosphate nucleotidase [Planctomycetota bacterium]|jgi:3'(2'), 5'-bisphosphate nucleotidase